MKSRYRFYPITELLDIYCLSESKTCPYDFNDTNDQYLDLATAQDVLGDARIKAVRAKLKPVADEYRKIQSERPDKAADYYRKHEKELTAYRIIDQQSRLMQKNRKLLGNGGDKAIMKLISNNRNAALKAIDETK